MKITMQEAVVIFYAKLFLTSYAIARDAGQDGSWLKENLRDLPSEARFSDIMTSIGSVC